MHFTVKTQHLFYISAQPFVKIIGFLVSFIGQFALTAMPFCFNTKPSSTLETNATVLHQTMENGNERERFLIQKPFPHVNMVVFLQGQMSYSTEMKRY